MQTIEDHRNDDRLVLVDATTDPVYYDGAMAKYKTWTLGKRTPIGDGVIELMVFNEGSRYLTIYLDGGGAIKKYKPITLVYRTYAETKEILLRQGNVFEPKTTE